MNKRQGKKNFKHSIEEYKKRLIAQDAYPYANKKEFIYDRKEDIETFDFGRKQLDNLFTKRRNYEH